MLTLDLAAIRDPHKRPDLPQTPARITGEQTRHGTPLVRLAWPCGKAAWIPAHEVVIVSKQNA